MTAPTDTLPEGRTNGTGKADAVVRLLAQQDVEIFETGGRAEDAPDVPPLTDDAREFLASDDAPKAETPEAELSDRETCAQIARSADLWHTPEGVATATFTVNGHREHAPVRSRRFKSWLMLRFRDKRGKAPSLDALSTAQQEAEAVATLEGPERPLYVRVAHHDGRVYIDLADDDWRAVEIDADGWRIVTDPPVAFLRTPDHRPLPEPARGGTLDALRPFVNAPDDDTWALMLGWLIGAVGDGPYLVLALSGAGGSAKTTTARYLRGVFDPTGTPTRRLPRKPDDFAIAARGAAVLAFDNLSGLSAEQSDTLCTLSTGDGLGKRELYSDDGERLFYARRPILLTGIGQVTTRGDLISRTIPLGLPAVGERRTEAELAAAWTGAHPAILGALLDAISRALATRESVEIPADVRMADATRWIIASGAVPAFADAYAGNREHARESEIEASPFCTALLGMVADQTRAEPGRWSGTPSDLLRAVTLYADDFNIDRGDGWPKVAHHVRGRIDGHAEALRSAGLEWTARKSGSRRLIEITLTPAP